MHASDGSAISDAGPISTPPARLPPPGPSASSHPLTSTSSCPSPPLPPSRAPEAPPNHPTLYSTPSPRFALFSQPLVPVLGVPVSPSAVRGEEVSSTGRGWGDFFRGFLAEKCPAPPMFRICPVVVLQHHGTAAFSGFDHGSIPASRHVRVSALRHALVPVSPCSRATWFGSRRVPVWTTAVPEEQAQSTPRA